MAKRRKYSSTEKLEVILLGLRNPGKESQVCRERGVHPSVYARWKKKFLEAGRSGLKHGASPETVLERENSELKDMLAQLYVENQYLKKTIQVGK